MLAHLILTRPVVKAMRHREAKHFIQGHVAFKVAGTGFTSSSMAPEFTSELLGCTLPLTALNAALKLTENILCQRRRAVRVGGGAEH